jgi:hypothetical protein
MKLALISIAAFVTLSGCGNPYIDSSVSIALSEKKKVALLEEQNAQLKRIADALEKHPSK